MLEREESLEEMGRSLVVDALTRPLVLPTIWKAYDADSNGWDGWPTHLIDMHDNA
jgi:hypothetical protein